MPRCLKLTICDQNPQSLQMRYCLKDVTIDVLKSNWAILDKTKKIKLKQLLKFCLFEKFIRLVLLVYFFLN